MQHGMRTFIGIRCGRDASKKLHRTVSAWGKQDAALKIPNERDFHLTLHFLGHTDERDISAIDKAMEAAVCDMAPFGVQYVGVGAFPRPERPRVLWTGVSEDAMESLAALAMGMRKHVGDLGYLPDRRKFHPHVTVARVNKKPQPSTLELLREVDAPEVLATDWVSEVKLILSDPSAGPYHYIDLTTQQLSG